MSTLTAPRARQPVRGDSGQALVEFSLVAPIFFLLTFGIIQLALVFGGQNGLVSAARELARYAATYHVATTVDATNVCNTASSSHGIGSQLSTSMQRAMPGYSSSNIVTRHITYSWATNPLSSGGTQTYYAQLTVHLVYKYPLYVPLVAAILDRLDGTTDN